ncbi:hypothetical protein HanXRQr2_Chr16g0725011 [Helianthus annuus]|uniref:Uncharacterized protein n=1 Tax=Helianthus annuus TaxID=4232 RepID=A0A251RW20_HELAN|nr:uncharacterized protein LOC110916981 [Helianthus annuus]KAF5758058.1 hypothetical protein HanXRQr2_Chr16g0725011 [Helianthus annuus]KAJ0436443.1 hypothetical protein HanHA300_Chr16g0590881 [Helianthus annuus]KAJ0440614.1 hypothetical protein HanIR_Chr16g0788691 [Helianthus annuus]KAJ0458729.1 hypothetical protein HanHA89_Chr16g0641101 [Helianthus annuus]KAJ0819363.1 hypothetical protein HanPSC8_Chr16g0695201 [Helianthus annuus]
MANLTASSLSSTCFYNPTKLNSLGNLNAKLPSSKPQYKPITSMVGAPTKVIPSIIVGADISLGKALKEMGTGQDLVLNTGEPIPIDFPGPILVCTRNDDLDAVLESTPQSRWSDLVFFQDGMLEPWFESKGLIDANQVLPYFDVSRPGEPPVDGITDVTPEGLTAAFGKWAADVASRLHAGGLTCKVLEKEPFQKQMMERLLWISAVMLTGALVPGTTVGDVASEAHLFELAYLIPDMITASQDETGIEFADTGTFDRFLAYSRAVGHIPAVVEDFKWRNGWFYSITEKALAQGKEDPMPLHTKFLKALNLI